MEGPLLPRGRTSKSEAKSLSRHDERNDVPLFGQLTKKKKRNSSTKQEIKHDKKAKVDEVDNSQKKISSLLTYSKLAVGMKLLACVKQVTTEKVVLSLINNVTTTVMLSEISDEHFKAFENAEEPPSNLTEFLEVNSFVRCLVTSVGTETDRLLRVSCRVSLLNKGGGSDPSFASLGTYVCGTIKSLEDNGAVINLGTKVSGFMPFSAISGGKKSLKAVGQFVEGIVTSIPSKLVVHLKPYEFGSVVPIPSFSLLQPGNMIETKLVRDDLIDGGSLFNWLGFNVVSDWLHCSVNSVVNVKNQACVVWVDTSSKTIGVSFLTHLQKRTPLEFTRPIGDIIQDALITGCQPRYGLKLSLPEPAFAHVSKLVDENETPPAAIVKRDFEIGTKVACRVLEYNQIDGMYVTSLQASVLKAAVTSYESLVSGQKVQGKVVKVDASFGLVLELGQNIRGIVTLMHLADSARADTSPEHFKIGQICKGRVLNAEGDRVTITLKNALVKNSEAIISMYEQAKVGTIASGFITKVEPFGVIVSFFGKVHGIVPGHALGPNFVTNPSEFYHIGQVVKVRVVSVDPSNGKMKLSMDLTKQNITETIKYPTPGAILKKVVVVLKNERGVLVEFTHENHNIKGFIFKGHFSDFSKSVEVAFNSLSTGSRLKNVVVLGVDEQKKEVILSLKPELIRSLESHRFPKEMDEINQETIYPGYVANIATFGVFVNIGTGFTVFVPNANVWDSFVGKADDYFALHQTVLVSVSSIELETKRLVGTLKPSVVGSSSAPYLQMLLEERKKSFIVGNPNSHQIASLTVGKAVSGQVTHRVEGVGIGVKIENEFDGFCSIEHCPNQKLPRVGNELNFRILDVDLSQKGVIDLSARKSLENAKWKEEVQGYSLEFDVDVEIGKKEYAIVSYSSKENRDLREIAFCSMVNFNNSNSPPQPLKVGSKCRVRSHPNSSILEIVSRSTQENQSISRPRARSGSLTEFLGPKIHVELGGVINARIRDIKGCWMRLDVRQVNSSSKLTVHSTDVIDHDPKMKYRLMDEIPGAFSGHSVADVVQAKVIEKAGSTFYLSLRPSHLQSETLPKSINWEHNPPTLGQTYQGWVDQVTTDGVFIGLSRTVRGFAYCTDVCDDPALLDQLFNQQKANSVFSIGRPVKVQTINVNKDDKTLDFKMLWDL